MIFLGPHSPFSNMFSATFTVDNVEYGSTEQFIQASKAALFDDDVTHSRIMGEINPFRIKKLGGKVRKFNQERWRQKDKHVAYKAVKAKFTQNPTLRNLLIETGDKLIAESSYDQHWGTGLHLRDENALDSHKWSNRQGGIMGEILVRV